MLLAKPFSSVRKAFLREVADGREHFCMAQMFCRAQIFCSIHCSLQDALAADFRTRMLEDEGKWR